MKNVTAFVERAVEKILPPLIFSLIAAAIGTGVWLGVEWVVGALGEVVGKE